MTGWERETNEEYHSRTDSYSSSQVKLLLQHSPAYFKSVIDGKVKRVQTDALRLGSLIHEAILEGEQFVSRYVVMPRFDGHPNSTEHRKAKANFLAVNANRQIVSPDELQMLQGIYKSVMSHRDARRCLQGCDFEMSGYFTHPRTGLPLRIKPDAYDPHRRILIDVKSVKSIKREHFPYAIRDYRWDVSMALYAAGIWAINGEPPDSCVFIAVEKTPPYEVAVYELGEPSFDKGTHDLSVALDTLSKCLETGIWPAYQEAFETIDLPLKFIEGGKI